MSTPQEQAEKLTAAEQNRVGAAIALAAQQNAGQAQPSPQTVQMLAHNSLLMLIDSRVAAMIEASKAVESKAVTFAKRYWPVAAGLAIAATRLIH